MTTPSDPIASCCNSPTKFWSFKHSHWLLLLSNPRPNVLVQPQMDDNCSARLHDAMDKLWFHQNILFFQSVGLNTPLLPTRGGSNSAPLNQTSQMLSTPLAENSSLLKSAAEKKNCQPVNEERRPTRLNIIIGQPLFQLQQPPRSKIQSLPSSLLINEGTESKNKRRMLKKMRSSKSLSELENYELKGFMDLGFVFHKDKLSTHMISMLPGLQRLGEKGDGSEERREVDEKKVKRPYLSEAWFINRSNSPPLLNFRMLPKSTGKADMKKQLRFWARTVASLINEEPDGVGSKAVVATGSS